MINLKYHIVSLIGVFLALGLGILIGSTIVSDDIMVGQQQKMIADLETKFSALRQREDILVAQNSNQEKIIADYENYSQAILPFVVKGQLNNTRTAIIVTGGQDIPAGLPNTISLAGGQVVSQTVVLNNINLKDDSLRKKITNFYNLEDNASADELRQKVAASLALLLCNKADQTTMNFLQNAGLVSFRGQYFTPVDQVVLVGGASSKDLAVADSLDGKMIETLLGEGKNVTGVEGSKVQYSYMGSYQNYNITTIDNIDLSPGQISLILSMTGEPGDYGIKATASKFMPSLPVDKLGGAQ